MLDIGALASTEANAVTDKYPINICYWVMEGPIARILCGRKPWWSCGESWWTWFCGVEYSFHALAFLCELGPVVRAEMTELSMLIIKIYLDANSMSFY